MKLKLQMPELIGFISGLFCLAILVSPTASAQMVKGTNARANVDKLTSQVHWFSTLRDAEDSARTKDRPILWMHMLGKIDGAT